MSSVRLPNKIYGKWIWKTSAMSHPDGFMLMRREFSSQALGPDVTMWIAAVNNYQLFLNGRLIGFGPRAHQSRDAVFIDQHELGDYLENGVNVITVLVSYNVDSVDPKRRPGLWCQLATPSQELFCSDEKWLLRDGGEFESNRPRFSRDGGLTSVIQGSKLPVEWQLPVFTPDASWMPPDYVASVESAGLRLELHPLPPPVISPDRIGLALIEGGRIAARPVWSEVVFRGVPGDGSNYAGVGFAFSEQPMKVKLRIFSDDPFKLFCGGKMLCSGTLSEGKEEIPLTLRAGWNKFILYQTPRYNAMGATLIFSGFGVTELHMQQDMTMDAPDGWLTVGPLKMSLAESTPSLQIAGLPLTVSPADPDNMVDPGDLLCSAKIEPGIATGAETPMRSGDYRIYRLDLMRYGFIHFELVADVDDVVDVVIGVRRSENGFIQAAPGVRGCLTLHCREGINAYSASVPADCLYVAVVIRHAKQGIAVHSVDFDELVSAGHEELEDFFSSDSELNLFWQVGKQTLRRSAAFIPLSDAGSGNDCAMLDAYIDSMNMAAVFGDSDYIAFRLRRFLTRQYESGEIPVLTFSRRRRRQLWQMFFLPAWINYNYRFSGNRVEFDRAIEALDRALEFFEGMIDDAGGVMSGLKERFDLEDEKLEGIDGQDVPEIFNALFCRFLLSAAESYDMAGNPTQQRHCRRLAARIAAGLKESCFDAETGLYSESRIGMGEPRESVEANFYALCSGVLPLEEFERFFFAFFTFEPPYNRYPEVSPEFHFLFLEMLFALGQREWAMGYFREYWSKRLCEDACAWYDQAGVSPARTQFSGGNSVSPNLFLLREILGIRLSDTGSSVICFNPAFREVRFAQGVVPTPRGGRLMVRWEMMQDGSLDVTLNATIPLKILPELSPQRLALTTFRLSDQVTLLKPPEDINEEDTGDYVAWDDYGDGADNGEVMTDDPATP